MPRLDMNFDDVPDEIVPLEPGIYRLGVAEAPKVEPTNDGTSTKLVVRFEVIEPEKFKGRALQDHISIKMLTRIKRLFLSAGLKPGASGIDTEELTGAEVRALLKERSWKDPDTGETRVSVRVDDYIVE